MNKKKELNIIKFPSNITEPERQVEAILFAAEEPLDLESISTWPLLMMDLTNLQL